MLVIAISVVRWCSVRHRETGKKTPSLQTRLNVIVPGIEGRFVRLVRQLKKKLSVISEGLDVEVLVYAYAVDNINFSTGGS